MERHTGPAPADPRHHQSRHPVESRRRRPHRDLLFRQRLRHQPGASHLGRSRAAPHRHPGSGRRRHRDTRAPAIRCIITKSILWWPISPNPNSDSGRVPRRQTPLSGRRPPDPREDARRASRSAGYGRLLERRRAHASAHHGSMAYLVRHLKPDGMLAFNITNRYLDLEPVVAEAASANGFSGIVVDDDGAEEDYLSPSTWVLLSRILRYSNTRISRTNTSQQTQTQTGLSRLDRRLQQYHPDPSKMTPLRRHHFPERLPAVSGAAADRQDHSAVVRRIGRGVERRDAVFPACAAGRIRVRARLHPLS